jgi:hypothetical protein
MTTAKKAYCTTVVCIRGEHVPCTHESFYLNKGLRQISNVKCGLETRTDRSFLDSVSHLTWFDCMKSGIKLVVILTAVAVGGCIGRSEVSQTGEDEIRYRDEKIKLTKRYSNYDDCKNDPDNIGPSELARVQRLVREAPIAPSFFDRWQMLQAVSALAFPGYGSWQFGDKSQADGSVISGHGIPVPRADKARILVIRSRGKGFDLIDDFIGPFDASIEHMIVNVTIHGGQLIYATFANTTVLTRDFREKAQ